MMSTVFKTGLRQLVVTVTRGVGKISEIDEIVEILFLLYFFSLVYKFLYIKNFPYRCKSIHIHLRSSLQPILHLTYDVLFSQKKNTGCLQNM